MTDVVVTTRLPSVADLSVGSLNDEWLRQRYGPDDVVVLVDELSPAAEALMADGYRVDVHPKRGARIDAETVRTGDEARARMIAALAPSRLLYGSDFEGDLGWLEPTLAAVPTVVLPSGALTDCLAAVLDDPRLFGVHGRQAWAVASRLATADIGDSTPVSWLGVRRDDKAEIPGGDASVPHPGALVVVTALAATRAQLAHLLATLADRVALDPTMTLVVVHRRLRTGPDEEPNLVLAGQTGLPTPPVLVPVGADGSAASFVAAADILVVATAADLCVPAVAARADEVGVSVLFPPVASDLTMPAVPTDGNRSDERVVSLAATNAADVAAALRALLADQDGPDVAVLATRSAAADGDRLAAWAGLGRHDVTLLATADPRFGSPDPRRIRDDVVGLHRRTWPSVARWMDTGHPPPTVIRWLATAELASHVTVLLLPVSRAMATHESVPLVQLPAFLTAGPVGPLNLARPRIATVPGKNAPAVDRFTAVVRRTPGLRSVAGAVPVSTKIAIHRRLRSIRGRR